MSHRNSKLPPPNGGQAIRSPYLKQEHRRLDRASVQVLPPLFMREGDGGSAIGLRLPGYRLARTTSEISPAAHSGGDVTAFGTGTAALYDCTGDGASVNADKGTAVKSVGLDPIESGSIVLLYPIFGEAVGLFVLGRICPPTPEPES